MWPIILTELLKLKDLSVRCSHMYYEHCSISRKWCKTM